MKASNNQFPSILVTEQGSAPASPASGDQRLYMKTDHVLYHVDHDGLETAVGVASDPFGIGTLTAPPALGSWTADNISSYFAAAATNGVISFKCSLESGDKIRGYYRAYPTPVKVTAAFVLGLHAVGYDEVGLYVSDGTKYKLFGMDGLGVPHWVYFDTWNHWSGESSGSNAYNYRSPAIWMQYEEDSTNRYFRMSPNGIDWITYFSETKTTSVTGTRIGFGSYVGTAGPNSSPGAIANLVHWVEG